MRLRLTMSLGVLLLMFGPLSAFVVPVRSWAQGTADITCADFVRQEAAQALLDADDAYAETLDPDGDGVACNQTLGDAEGTAEGEATEEATEEPAEEPTEAATEEPTPEATAETDEAAEEEATATPSGSPINGRFGSKREYFEEVYGEPADEGDAETYPLGVAYVVDGFAGVNVFYHRGYVVYITLTARRDAPWSQSEAEEVVLDFLPADWERTGEPIETEEGDLLIPGHSQALETRFSATTYDRYGARGEQGDAYFLLRLNADNDVEAIEIGLGNAEQSRPDEGDEGDEGDQGDGGAEEADAEAEEGNASEGDEVDAQEYLADVRGQFETLSASVNEFFAIVNDPNFTTDQALLDRLVEILVVWSSASTNAQDLTPPAELEELHQTFLEYTELLSGAAVDLTAGLSTGDEASIQAGGEKLQQASALQPTIEELLTQAGG